MSELYLNEPLPPYSMPIKPILVLDSPTIPRVTTPKGSNSPSPKSEARRSNKKVSFAADTVMPRDDNLALSITKHAYTKDLGYTQYTVDVSLSFANIVYPIALTMPAVHVSRHLMVHPQAVPGLRGAQPRADLRT